MGKTFAARLPAAAAALDPFVQLLVFDGEGGKDWQPFELVAHRYGSGVRRTVVEHLIACLRELVDEMNRRYEALRELPNDVCPEGKLTPAIARNKALNMPLVLVAIDEVQRYLEHPELGGAITELLTELVKVAPAVGIMLVLATQRPDAKTLPEGLRGQIGTRFALKVMNWQSSETILGAGTKADGLDASKLLRAHKGVGILLGADDGDLAEAGGQVVRTHLMDLPTLQRICERGRELRIQAGTLTGVAAGEEPIAETPAPKFLDQVLDVFGAGESRLWSETIVARLAERDPDRFDGWSPTDLANALRPYGVATSQVWGQTPEGESANRRGVTREAVLEALGRSIDTPSRRSRGGPDAR
jgi:S-DNA-T family DNA segregation ATPase FtsK/SpoIIIE